MAATWPGPGGSPQAWSSNWARQLGLRLNWVIDEGLDVGGIRAVLNGAAAIKAGLCETVVVATATAGGPAQSGRDRMAAIHHGGPSSFRGRQRRARRRLPRGPGVQSSVRRLRGDPSVRLERHASHARLRDDARTDRPGCCDHTQQRLPQSRGHVLRSRTLFRRGHPRVTMDRRAAAPARVQPRRAVRCRDRPDQRRAGARPQAAPVYVLAGAMEMDDGPHHNPALNRVNGDLGSKRMKVAYSQVGITPGDIDVLSVYDPTAFEVIRNLEMLGFCGPGEGGLHRKRRDRAEGRFRRTPTVACSAMPGRRWANSCSKWSKVPVSCAATAASGRSPGPSWRYARIRARCAPRRGTDSGERAMTTTK